MDKSYLNIFSTGIVVFYLRLVWLQHQQRAKLPLPYPLAHPCPPHPSFLLMLQSVGLWLLHTHLLTILGHPCHRHKNTHSLFKTITFPRSSLSLSKVSLSKQGQGIAYCSHIFVMIWVQTLLNGYHGKYNNVVSMYIYCWSPHAGSDEMSDLLGLRV